MGWDHYSGCNLQHDARQEMNLLCSFQREGNFHLWCHVCEKPATGQNIWLHKVHPDWKWFNRRKLYGFRVQGCTVPVPGSDWWKWRSLSLSYWIRNFTVPEKHLYENFPIKQNKIQTTGNLPWSTIYRHGRGTVKRALAPEVLGWDILQHRPRPWRDIFKFYESFERPTWLLPALGLKILPPWRWW